MSDYGTKAEVIEVTLIPHPNADKLSLVRIGDYQVGVRTDEWSDGDLGVFVQPDSVVPNTPEFSWVGPDRRVRPRRFRGTWSHGLLVHAPAGSLPGDDVAELLGITRYEPPEDRRILRGDAASAPGFHVPTYSVEPYKRYPDLFVENEPVVFQEKIHGENARFVYDDIERTFHVGSHRVWRKPGDNLYWKVLNQTPWLRGFLQDNPLHVVFGEIFGQQDLKYGLDQHNFGFKAFDIWHNHTWWDYRRVIDQGLTDEGRWTPVFYYGPFSKAKVLQLTSGPTWIEGADNIREGIVIKPIIEQFSIALGGRLMLKSVSDEYLERSK